MFALIGNQCIRYQGIEALTNAGGFLERGSHSLERADFRPARRRQGFFILRAFSRIPALQVVSPQPRYMGQQHGTVCLCQAVNTKPRVTRTPERDIDRALDRASSHFRDHGSFLAIPARQSPKLSCTMNGGVASCSGVNGLHAVESVVKVPLPCVWGKG